MPAPRGDLCGIGDDPHAARAGPRRRRDTLARPSGAYGRPPAPVPLLCLIERGHDGPGPGLPRFPARQPRRARRPRVSSDVPLRARPGPGATWSWGPLEHGDNLIHPFRRRLVPYSGRSGSADRVWDSGSGGRLFVFARRGQPIRRARRRSTSLGGSRGRRRSRPARGPVTIGPWSHCTCRHARWRWSRARHRPQGVQSVPFLVRCPPGAPRRGSARRPLRALPLDGRAEIRPRVLFEVPPTRRSMLRPRPSSGTDPPAGVYALLERPGRHQRGLRTGAL